MTNFRYEKIRSFSKDEVLHALKRGDADELSVIVVGIALHHEDSHFAEQFCLQLTEHENDLVRGNAILGFGHLARRFRELNAGNIKQIVEAALIDDSKYVRGQAWAAADDITHFLGWAINGFDET